MRLVHLRNEGTRLGGSVVYEQIYRLLVGDAHAAALCALRDVLVDDVLELPDQHVHGNQKPVPAHLYNKIIQSEVIRTHFLTSSFRFPVNLSWRASRK